jgi:outer membrane protein
MLNGFRLVLLSCLIVAPMFLQANAADLKIGYVNMQRVLREAPASIEAGKKLDQEFAKRRQELQRGADDIKARQAALSEKGTSLSDRERQAKEAEITEMSVKLQRRQQEFQEDIKVLQDKEMSAILEKANKAIIQIAESEHLDVIFQEAIAVSNRVDITDKLIKKLSGN